MSRELTLTGAQYSNEQRFTSPGTWTCPPGVTWVQVIVVGGGGGSGAFAKEYPYSEGEGTGGGGGGAVLVRTVPVSAPVPVTVGAGGAAGVTYTQPIPTPVSAPISICGGVGGTSAFGPLGPGPIPAIPATTIAAGGGGGGGQPLTPDVSRMGVAAPPIGGGAGGTTPAFKQANSAGYGSPSIEWSGGGAGYIEKRYLDDIRQASGFGPIPSSRESNLTLGVGILGFGGGGVGGRLVTSDSPPWNVARAVDGGGSITIRYQNPPVSPYTFDPTAPTGAAQANTGGGGGGLVAANPIGIPVPAPNDYANGYAGGSGVVIVRWNQ
jgi:hypothetical protein